MQIRVFGKNSCIKCDAAKEKLQLMGFHYDFYDLEQPTHFRGTGKVEAMARYQLTDDLPQIRTINTELGDEKKWHTYSEAMAYLRPISKAQKAVDEAKRLERDLCEAKANSEGV